MKANIVCKVCNVILGSIVKPNINDYDVERYQGSFMCDCGGEAELIIQQDE